jgi:hypothetical protein
LFGGCNNWKEWKRAVLEAKVHKGLWYLRRRRRNKNI